MWKRMLIMLVALLVFVAGIGFFKYHPGARGDRRALEICAAARPP